MTAWANNPWSEWRESLNIIDIKEIGCPGCGFWLKEEVATVTSDFLIGFIGLMFVSLTKTANMREDQIWETE